MNRSLHEGATDGRYKKVRPDTECAVTDDAVKNLTYETRDDMSLPYYGIGMKRLMTVPGGPQNVETPDYYDNKLQQEVNSGILGRTW
jgi:hypothetical protein